MEKEKKEKEIVRSYVWFDYWYVRGENFVFFS